MVEVKINPTVKETIAHGDLSDMPDSAGSNEDHDARYYTETEVDAEIDADVATHAALASVHHARYTDAEAVTAAKTVKLDDFTAPDDNTDLDASAALHGLMAKADKSKLDGVEASANAYVHPNHSGEVTSVADGAQTIANDAVTYAKMQNVSATDKVLGRATAGAGDVEEIACTTAGRALLDDADAAAQKTTLGLNNVENTAHSTNAHTMTIDGRDVSVDGTKLDGIEALADVTDATNVNAAGATMNADTDVSANSWVLDEDNMASDSAVKLATQQSIKAYADLHVAKSLLTTADDVPYATGASTWARLAVPASSFVGKKATGNLAAMTASEALQLLANGQTGGAIFVPITTVIVVHHYSISSTPRTYVVSSIAGAVITLTTTDANKLFRDTMTDHCYLKVTNTTAPRAGEVAWLKDQPATNQVTVTDSAAISGWQANDVITMAQDGATDEFFELDLSPIVPAGGISAFAATFAFDSGGYCDGMATKQQVGAGFDVETFPQAASQWIGNNGITRLTSARHCLVRQLASGADTLRNIIRVQGYFGSP